MPTLLISSLLSLLGNHKLKCCEAHMPGERERQRERNREREQRSTLLIPVGVWSDRQPEVTAVNVKLPSLSADGTFSVGSRHSSASGWAGAIGQLGRRKGTRFIKTRDPSRAVHPLAPGRLIHGPLRFLSCSNPSLSLLKVSRNTCFQVPL